MKKILNELPKSWYVVVTEKNKEILSKWREVNLPTGYITGMYDWGSKIEKEHNPNYDDERWGDKISFEDFKRLVLKENIDKTYELW